jgi:hypothetical protein
MKKLIVSICLLFGAVAFVNAQDTTQTQSPTQPTQATEQEQDRVQVQIGELPAPIKTSLESQDYSGWTVSSAFRTSQTDASDETKSMEVYVVELKNGAETKTVKFDKDGKKIEDEKKDQK